MERDIYTSRLDTRLRLSPPVTPLRPTSRDASLRLLRSPIRQPRLFLEPDVHLASIVDNNNLSISQKDLATRIANAAAKIHQWHDELERWKWSGSFDKDSSDVDISSNNGEVEQSFGRMSEHELLNRYTSLSLADVSHYETILDGIYDELPQLDLDDLKERVLDIHQANSRPSSRGSVLTVSSFVFLDDFSFFVTRTLIRSLPTCTILRRQLKTWSSRLGVIRGTPVFLQRYEAAALQMIKAWKELRVDIPNQYHESDIEQEQTRLDKLKDKSQSRISEAATSLDAMLDLLEEQEDVLPDQWIDSFEKIEADFAEWCLVAEQRIFNLRVGLQSDLTKTQEIKPVIESEERDSGVSRGGLEIHPEKDVNSNYEGDKKGEDGPNNALQGLLKVEKSEKPFSEHSGDPENPENPENLTNLLLGVKPLPPQSSEDRGEFVTESQPSSNEIGHTTPQGSIGDMTITEPEPLDKDLVTSQEPSEESSKVPQITRGVEGLSSIPGESSQTTAPEQALTHPRIHIEEPQDTEAAGHAMEAKYVKEASAADSIPAAFATEDTKTDESESDLSTSESNVTGQHSTRASSSFSPIRNSAITESSLFSDLADDSSFTSAKQWEGEEQDRPVTPEFDYEEDIPSFLDDVTGLSATDMGESHSDMEDSPLQRKHPGAKMPTPPLNAIVKKRGERGSTLRLTTFMDDEALLSSSPQRSPSSPPNDRTSLSPVSPVMPLEQQISDILDRISTPIRLRTGPKPNAPEVKRTRLRTVSNQSHRPIIPSRSMTPALTLAPAEETTRRHNSHGSDIRLYHLIQTGQDKPIKLFIRRVGENGERVMVRVGGGWADLAEYLRIYAEHHGRRAVSDGRVDIQALNADKAGTKTTPKTTDSRRASLLGPASRSGTPTGDRTNDVDSTAGTPRFATVTPQSAASAGSRRGVGWDEVGLSGPKTKRGEMSDEKKEWVDGIVEQAKRGLGKNMEVGDMGKSGATRRIYFKNPAGAAGRKTPAPE